MQLSPLPCYLAPLRPKNPQHPTLERPQLMFLPQGARPLFTIIEYNSKITILYILMYFLIAEWKASDMHRKIARYSMR